MRFAPHPPVLPRPQALWRRGHALDDSLRRTAAALPYRPDWYVHRAAWKPIAFRHPACAITALMDRYGERAPELEPALAGSGESVCRLLDWLAETGVRPHRPPSFYRDILVRDGYWGLRHARRTRDPKLEAEVEEWAGDHRREFGSAAALFLAAHPREPIRPYVDALHAHPFYMYTALPRLHPRGLTVAPGEIRDPKWAYHFSLSTFTRGTGGFTATLMADPVWAVEYLYARTHGAPTIADLREWSLRLQQSAAGHPLLERALAALEPAERMPSPLAQGRQAESRVLGALGRPKNHQIWRPSPEQIQTPEFKRVVGDPQYTDLGFPRGTVVDAVDAGLLAEIKSGRSPLGATYQLKLQAYRALVEDRRLRIYTSRPSSPQFSAWLGPLGVELDPLP